MEKYLDKITPKVSTAWRTDELYLKVNGNTKYLYALMDDETPLLDCSTSSRNKEYC
jgi:putative transposase